MEQNASVEADKRNMPASGSLTRLALVPLVAVTVLISVAFIEISRPFLSALALAAICAILVQPFYRATLSKVGHRSGLASTITVVAGIILVVAPLIGISYLAATQAAGLISEAGELLDSLSNNVDSIRGGTFEYPQWVPFREDLAGAGPQIIEKTNELLGSIASFLASSLSGLTNGTANFFLGLFTFIYALFFFLPLETSAFRPILKNSGLSADLQDKLHDRIVSVSRATIKGTLLIGVIQGALGGVGFWAAGIEGAAFWSVVMAIAAAIPGIGATGIVVGGAIYLLLEGSVAAGIGLAAWAFLVVGTIDNVLRPTLVGREAQMSDLMIFVSTLGGLAVFGASGLIFGPVIAGVFVTTWQAVSEATSALTSASDVQNVAARATEPISTPPPGNGGPGKSKQQTGPDTTSKDDLKAQVEALKREFNEGDPR
ncbi:AI-2E family transporter [uncultured Ruegeria sp.]|uniref:AI-2E family transporter n=1 Tax=uncultured Ruegeria sp. TaxID=259304 RepID=UPI0026241BF8|nr:AI-2E family transporter [uncultured Ruegeria sp.]